jgi:uncharacterized SAM-binding protein YcdF (DUF218 family)
LAAQSFGEAWSLTAARKRVLITMAGGLLASFVFGFMMFAIAVTRGVAASEQADLSNSLGGRLADGIVVLTGGEKRIVEAVRLLDNGSADRLLITGVNRKTSRDDVRRLVAASSPRRSRAFDCCIDIGYDALDTIGNADEARTWAKERHFNSLIVVTASNHMPRSLAELRLKLPSIQLIPHPVVPNRLRASPWWLHPEVARELALEYLKFLPAAARYSFVRLVLRPHSAQSVVQAAKPVRS